MSMGTVREVPLFYQDCVSSAEDKMRVKVPAKNSDGKPLEAIRYVFTQGAGNPKHNPESGKFLACRIQYKYSD